MKTLAGFSLVLVIVLVSLSAYLRLAHSGIGCGDWPACYGRIGAPPPELAMPGDAPPVVLGSAYQRLLQRSGESLAWATPAHRLVASVLGIAVVLLNLLAWRQARHRLNALALLLLTFWLAMLGIRSGSLHDPAVVMGNLSGGFAMLGLLGWLRFRQTAAAGAASGPAVPLGWLLGALFLLAGQILLGGFTSANFAASACRTLPDCHGGWWPGPELATALDLTRHHQVTPSGQAVGGAERIAIHRAHRLGAIAAGLAALVAGGWALRARGSARRAGALIIGLVLAELAVGVASVLLGLPIGLAVAHNWLAALLLLALLWLLAQRVRTRRTNQAANSTNSAKPASVASQSGPSQPVPMPFGRAP